MVGTAVYQVGLASSISAKNFERVEPRRAEHGAAARERSAKAGDQPVDMEQGHHVERRCRFRKARARPRCCGPRSRCWHGRSGTIFGREVVPEVCRMSATSSGLAGPGRMAAPSGAPESSNAPAPTCRLRSEGQDRDAKLLGGAKSGRVAARFDDQRLRLEILEIELELVLPIGGIERRRGRRGGHAQKRRRHLGSVRQNDRDPIAKADPEIVQRCAVRSTSARKPA